MNFVLKPSLEHMALVKIGTSLWHRNDVRALISTLSDDTNLRPSEWNKIEKRVTDKVLQLSLPQPLKEKVFGVIKPIRIQLFEWIQCYNPWIESKCHLGLNLPAHLPAALCWTPHGTVDRKRTAEVLVRDESLHIITRYVLACIYFLEDDIIRFWNRLPQGVKDFDWDYCPVIGFWSDNMNGGGVGHISYQYEFYSSVIFGSKGAAKYFLQKLTPQEKEECLEEIAKYDDADVLCFLLAEMEKEEQKTVFKSNPDDVMECFLQWPWQSFFIGVANRMWDFLSKNDYDKIFRAIIGKVRDGYKDYNYQKLFGEFWQKSPSALKDSVTEAFLESWLTLLFDIKDKENIRLILKDATLAAKEKLIYSGEIKHSCERSICGNDWDFLEFFIRECFASNNDMFKFKLEFEKCTYFTEHCSATNKRQWNGMLFSMLCSSDDSSYKYDKRSVEEGESSSSKQFKSL